jgi:hypothetical protein
MVVAGPEMCGVIGSATKIWLKKQILTIHLLLHGVT